MATCSESGLSAQVVRGFDMGGGAGVRGVVRLNRFMVVVASVGDGQFGSFGDVARKMLMFGTLGGR